MKSLILLVLAAVGVRGAVYQSQWISTVIQGNITSPNSIAPTAFILHPAIADTIQTQEVTLEAGWWMNITGVHAAEVGVTQNAIAHIVAGGVGHNNVTIRMQSARGGGLFYQWTVWGRYW